MWHEPVPTDRSRTRFVREGTATLTVRGLPATVDATRVSCPAFGLNPTTRWLLTRPAAQQVRLLPGSYTFVSCATGPSFPVTLTPAGTFDYPPDLPAVSGRGTATLVVG